MGSRQWGSGVGEGRVAYGVGEGKVNHCGNKKKK